MISTVTILKGLAKTYGSIAGMRKINMVIPQQTVDIIAAMKKNPRFKMLQHNLLQ